MLKCTNNYFRMVEVIEKKLCINIPFSSSEHALLASEVLNVDKELKSSGVRREIIANGQELIVNFHGAELKKLRVAVNAFLKNVLLIVKTIDLFPAD